MKRRTYLLQTPSERDGGVQRAGRKNGIFVSVMPRSRMIQGKKRFTEQIVETTTSRGSREPEPQDGVRYKRVIPRVSSPKMK
jgi:hypothetical protein